MRICKEEKTGSITLNCFSPPVMLATLIIETTLAVYTVWRYKMTALTRLVVLMLLFLAAFQLAEYNVCTGPGPHAVPWSRLGFITITALPVLGLQIMHLLADKPNRRLVRSAYVFMAGFMLFFLLTPTAFSGHQCTGNYVIFQFTPWVTGIYSVYYFGWLLTTLFLGFRWANDFKLKGKTAVNQLHSVQGLMVGYLIFLVPTALANVFRPKASAGIPSVMCGFAVLMALILTLYVMPRAGSAPKRSLTNRLKHL